MILIDKREIKSCCGKSQKIWKLSIPLKKEFLETFQKAGFTYLTSFLDAGMLYIQDSSLIVSGVFGLNELRLKCKNKNCENSIDKLEQIILQLN